MTAPPFPAPSPDEVARWDDDARRAIRDVLLDRWTVLPARVQEEAAQAALDVADRWAHQQVLSLRLRRPHAGWLERVEIDQRLAELTRAGAR